jgi:hypothetical protein
MLIGRGKAVEAVDNFIHRPWITLSFLTQLFLSRLSNLSIRDFFYRFDSIALMSFDRDGSNFTFSVMVLTA